MTGKVLAQSILLLAGTALVAASTETTRYTPHGLVDIGHGKDATSEFIIDLDEGAAAGVVTDDPRAIQDPMVTKLHAEIQNWLDQAPGGLKFTLTDAEAILGRLAAGGE